MCNRVRGSINILPMFNWWFRSGIRYGKKKIEGCSTRKSNEQLACTSTLIVEHMQLAAEMWHW